MKRAQLNKWCDLLESGEYTQAIARLHLKNPETGQEGFCCLGLYLHKVLGLNPIDEMEYLVDNDLGAYRQFVYPGDVYGHLPKDIAEKDFYNVYGSSKKHTDMTLAGMNDNGYSFMQIAEKLRENPEKYVKLED